MPTAPALLWQEAQPPSKAEWSTLTGFQPSVPWQASQAWVVGMWARGSPTARTELWQLPQAPGVTAAWSKRAGVHAFVVWQPSHAALVGGDSRACQAR